MPPSFHVVPIVLRVPRREIAYVKFLFESYEGVAVVRTLDADEARLVVIAVPDFVAAARAVAASLREEIGCEEIPVPATADVDWLGPDHHAREEAP